MLALASLTLGPGMPSASAATSWSTGVVRFEPTAGAALEVAGLGAYRGTIELRRGSGGVTIVNEVGLEDYVRGIQEVPASWPAAAQEAQAIAARTFALYTMLTRPSAVARAAAADICATESCQVYRGLGSERRAGGANWVRAVDATVGRVLLHRGGVILAKYASSNGGRSDPGGAPYLPAVDDPDDVAVSPWAQWRSAIPLAAVARALPGPGELIELNRAGEVVVARRRQPDGTVLDQGYSGRHVRAALNATAPTPPGVPVPVPSNRFVARTEAGLVLLDGQGYGHLLGMSQYGAMGKARRGLAADDILAAYYGGTRSTAVPATNLPPVVRVVLATGQPEVTVRSTGRFRVAAADRGSIAHLTGGSWTTSAKPGGLTVTSSSGDAEDPRLTVDPLGTAGIRIGISTPSEVVVRSANGAATSLGLLDQGKHDIPLSAPLTAGLPVDLEVVADAGGGRVRRVTVQLGSPQSATGRLRAHLAAGSAVPPEAPEPPPARGPAAAAAGACLVAVAAANVGSYRRTRTGEAR